MYLPTRHSPVSLWSTTQLARQTSCPRSMTASFLCGTALGRSTGGLLSEMLTNGAFRHAAAPFAVPVADCDQNVHPLLRRETASSSCLHLYMMYGIEHEYEDESAESEPDAR